MSLSRVNHTVIASGLATFRIDSRNLRVAIQTKNIFRLDFDTGLPRRVYIVVLNER